jgi:hypothetical protein
MAWLLGGKGTDKAPVTEGKEVAVGPFRVQGKVFQVMQKHAHAKEKAETILEDKEKKASRQDQGDGMGPIHPWRPSGGIVGKIPN